MMHCDQDVTHGRPADNVLHFAGAEPDVVIRVGGRVVQVQRKHPGVGTVVEVATA